MDPIGPGTFAWIEADRAIQFYRPGTKHRAGAALSRMVRHLKHAKTPPETIAEWRAFVHDARAGFLMDEHGEWVD